MNLFIHVVGIKNSVAQRVGGQHSQDVTSKWKKTEALTSTLNAIPNMKDRSKVNKLMNHLAEAV